MPDQASSLRVDRAIKTLRELALEKMRDAILVQRFKPGDRLLERTLCEELGVSRTIVREVLRHLEAEGLVATIPHQGPRVARIDVDAAAQIYELRAVLEAVAARACAERASPQDLARLGDALARIERGFAARDVPSILRATSEFYEVMFLSGGKTIAWTIVQTLNARINHLRAMTISSPGRHAQGPREMHRIFGALRARDPAGAEQACLDHVRAAAAIAVALLAQDAK
jgi:DNA-binding GntR family transcriptional regulator